MNNLKSYTEYAVSTPTTDFVIGFDFNYGTDAVNVTVDDVPALEAGYSVIYLNSTTIRLSPAVPTGVVRLQRETDIDVPDNQFTAGAKFIASNMDENFTQIRHAQQEVRDGFEKLSEDTYEIIDTLQDVGQAAQDAADAAEQAAGLANDAAAQVSDKVPKSATLPTYLTVAAGVDPLTGVDEGSYFNVRSEDDDTVAIEYQNVGGSAVATGKSYPSAGYVQGVVSAQDQVNQAQALFNNKYSEFRQPENGAVISELSSRSRNVQYITDYATAQDAINARRNTATYSYIPNGNYSVAGSLALSGCHMIEGQGDYSVLKFAGAGNGMVYSFVAGSKYDDHAKRSIKNLRIEGDYIAASNTAGTTIGLNVSGTGHAGEVHGVTFSGHATGYLLSQNYTSRGCYNMYRRNKVGLHLDAVTSYIEESIYARYNSEAGVLLTGRLQNISFLSGAIEGNVSARGLWVKDVPEDSRVTLNLHDVYMEVNADEVAGIPSVDIQDIEGMEVIVTGGSYGYNFLNGIWSGPYIWGNSVSVHGAILYGRHYANKFSLKNVLRAPVMNTTTDLSVARTYGLREPAIVTEYSTQTFSRTLFQVPFYAGIPKTVVGYTNNADMVYPFTALGPGVSRAIDTVNNYGDGSLEKLTFSDTGDYGLNYVTLFTTERTQDDLSVFVFALIAETDCEIGLVGADGATLDLSYFKLKAGQRYKMVRTIQGAADKTERFRMFSVNGACSVSFKPIALYQFNENQEANDFIESLQIPVDSFPKIASQADSTATDVAGLQADFNALLAKLKASGQML